MAWHLLPRIFAYFHSGDALSGAALSYCPEAMGAIQKFGPMVKSPSGYPRQPPYVAITRSSGRCFRTRVSPDRLRRLSEGAQEGAAHAVAIGKTRLPSDDVDRMAALLHHQ